MRWKCVFFYLILFVSAMFAFIIGGRGLCAQDGAAYGETPGYLAASDKEGRSLGACPLAHTEVKAEISGILSRVTVHQQFRNPFQEPIEAIYTFPLPHNASVDDMMIQLGERTIRGVIKRREDAKTIYEQAQARGQLAALLDQERPNIFTQQIANISPGQSVDVSIRYAEPLKYSNGGYSFVFPMVVGPRYIPGWTLGKKGGGWASDTTSVPDASLITPPVTPPGTRSGHDISIEVSLDPGVSFTNLHSEQHELEVVRSDRHGALVRLADRAVIPNKDFILKYDVAGSQLQDGLITHRLEGDGYFMLILQPPRTFKLDQIVPKELIFVLDTSGSMQGFPIEKAKETMMMALDQLYPNDMFNLITFSGSTRVLFPQPVPATHENLKLARQLLTSSYGSGGTEMMHAIRSALEPSDEQGHVRIVCFMTDGLVGNDMAIISEVQKHPNARVFAFGIGSAPNRFLLDKIAEEGRGAVEYVTLEGDAAAAAARFHDRIRNPLLTDITLEWGGSPVYDIYPRKIPDLFSAEPVVICGRYGSGGNARVRLRGTNGMGSLKRDIRMSLPDHAPQHEVLDKLWARYRIDSLMAEDFVGMQNGNARPDVREAITQLGMEHRLMTQFTSFVAVEERVTTEGGETKTIQVPVEMPEGLSYEGIFGIPPTRPVGGGRGGGRGGVVGGLLSSAPTLVPPPPRPLQHNAIRVGGNVQESKLVRKVEPVYPELAELARVSGRVVLIVTVDEGGNVTDVRISSGHPLLNKAAIDAVKQWKYSPTLLNGIPVSVMATTSIEFNLAASSNTGSVQPRIDLAVASIIARLRDGQPVGTEEFIRNGKAEVKLLVDSRSEATMGKLQSVGFEVISLPKKPTTIVGRILLEKLESLLNIDAVSHIAAYYH